MRAGRWRPSASSRLLPRAADLAALDGGEDAGGGEHLLHPGLALLAVAHAGEEVARLEHAQVVVAHRHAGARLEGGVVGMGRADLDRRVALVAVVGELEAPELVHALEAPAERASAAQDLYLEPGSWPDRDPAGLQRAVAASLELDQRGSPVLVLDVDEVVGRDAAEVRALVR